MEHKHAALIDKWRLDTSLIRLVKSTGQKWIKGNIQGEYLPWYGDSEYFLVCEKHVEVALHCLNGGDLESRPKECECWYNAKNIKHAEFLESWEYRIKPKFAKVKVWIGVNNKTGYFTASTDNLSDAYTWTEVEANKLIQ